jgi:predicted PurR-regulated permease PerM
MALLPVIGPPVVWLPAGILLLASGDIARGVVVMAVGALVIGTMDNVLRAILVGGRSRLHSLVVFFAVHGGVIVFGPAGVLLGPIMVVVAFSVLQVARAALNGHGETAAAPPGGGMALTSIQVIEGP